MDSYGGFIDDPQPAFDLFLVEKGQQLLLDTQNVSAALTIKTHNNQASELVRRIGADICKVQIKSDQCTPFFPADRSKMGVRDTLKFLIPDSQGLMPVGLKDCGGFWWKIFVDLESH
jgi:hypothetical protein